MTNIKLCLSLFLFITTAPIHGMLLTRIKNSKHQPIAPKRNLSLVPLTKHPDYLVMLPSELEPEDLEDSSHTILKHYSEKNNSDKNVTIKFTNLDMHQQKIADTITGNEIITITYPGKNYRSEAVIHTIIEKRHFIIYKIKDVELWAAGKPVTPLNVKEIDQLFSSDKNKE